LAFLFTAAGRFCSFSSGCRRHVANAASSLCAAHRHNNEAASQWKGRVIRNIVVLFIRFLYIEEKVPIALNLEEGRPKDTDLLN
jgi:hypothetical protein